MDVSFTSSPLITANCSGSSLSMTDPALSLSLSLSLSIFARKLSTRFIFANAGRRIVSKDKTSSFCYTGANEGNKIPFILFYTAKVLKENFFPRALLSKLRQAIVGSTSITWQSAENKNGFMVLAMARGIKPFCNTLFAMANSAKQFCLRRFSIANCINQYFMNRFAIANTVMQFCMTRFYIANWVKQFRSIHFSIANCTNEYLNSRFYTAKGMKPMLVYPVFHRKMDEPNSVLPIFPLFIHHLS